MLVSLRRGSRLASLPHRPAFAPSFLARSLHTKPSAVVSSVRPSPPSLLPRPSALALIRFASTQPPITTASTTTSSVNPSAAPSPSAPAAPVVNPVAEVLVNEPAPPVTWVESMPKSVKPYLYLIRIDKPIGTWLLFWPCAWGIILSSTVNGLPASTPIFYCALFGAGALIMRGAGCIINDMWDQKFDRAVERTKHRPLAAGDVTNTQAGAFLVANLAGGLAVLTQLNPYSIALGASSLGLVFIYPFMKRITNWPQFTFGLAFNWGILLGWSATSGSVAWPLALPLYFGGVLYGILYDTIYAHQDKVDDVLAGVKSTALLFAEKTKPALAVLGAGFVASLAYTGWATGASPVYYLVSVVGTSAHLAWQIRNVDLDVRSSCWRMFRSNKWLGGLIASGFGVDYWWRVGGGREMMGVSNEEKEKRIGTKVAGIDV